MNLKFIPVLLFVAFYCLPASAITRTIYFSQTGRNSSPSGPMNSTLNPSTCTIVITNPSSQTQTYNVTLNMTGRTVYTSPASSTNFTQSPVNSGVVSLAPGATSTAVSITGPTFSSTAAGYQDVTCSGNIIAADSGTNPGFVVATGVLMTFTESSNLMLSSASTFTGSNARQPIYIQVSVPVNEGRPF